MLKKPNEEITKKITDFIFHPEIKVLCKEILETKKTEVHGIGVDEMAKGFMMIGWFLERGFISLNLPKEK